MLKKKKFFVLIYLFLRQEHTSYLKIQTQKYIKMSSLFQNKSIVDNFKLRYLKKKNSLQKDNSELLNKYFTPQHFQTSVIDISQLMKYQKRKDKQNNKKSQKFFSQNKVNSSMQISSQIQNFNQSKNQSIKKIPIITLEETQAFTLNQKLNQKTQISKNPSVQKQFEFSMRVVSQSLTLQQEIKSKKHIYKQHKMPDLSKIKLKKELQKSCKLNSYKQLQKNLKEFNYQKLNSSKKLSYQGCPRLQKNYGRKVFILKNNENSNVISRYQDSSFVMLTEDKQQHFFNSRTFTKNKHKNFNRKIKTQTLTPNSMSPHKIHFQENNSKAKDQQNLKTDFQKGNKRQSRKNRIKTQFSINSITLRNKTNQRVWLLNKIQHQRKQNRAIVISEFKKLMEEKNNKARQEQFFQNQINFTRKNFNNQNFFKIEEQNQKTIKSQLIEPWKSQIHDEFTNFPFF